MVSDFNVRPYGTHPEGIHEYALNRNIVWATMVRPPVYMSLGQKNRSDRSKVITLAGPNRLYSDRDKVRAG